jgi:sulfoxide reductase heme-binding subunit YedZ
MDPTPPPLSRVNPAPASSRLQLLGHALAWIPALSAGAALLAGRLTANPIQDLMQRAGRAAIVLLILSLACTPIHMLTGERAVSRLRRTFGLYALLYAGVHAGIFLAIDYAFNVRLIWLDMRSKPFIYAGAAAALILLALGATSSLRAQRRLGATWRRLHRLVYLAAGLAVLHFAWARKGNLFTLRGDVFLPAVSAMAVAVLLALRLPPVTRWIARRRPDRMADPHA